MPPYKFDTSRAWSRHYGQDFGGAAGTITRVVFLADAIWPVPAGVTSIDILAVGGGGDALDLATVLGAPGGGGGGGIRVINGVAVAPGNNLQITGPSTPGSNVTVFNLSTVTQLIEASSGGDSANNGSAPAAGNGSGGGGDGATGLTGAGLGVGTGNNGGNGVDLVGPNGFGSAGGGGGAGAVGFAATAVAPGAGGSGAIPPASSFGAWGADIGEGGFFGGGGGGLFDIGPTAGAHGAGGGAANTGGGATATGAGDPGFSGIVVFMYLAP